MEAGILAEEMMEMRRRIKMAAFLLTNNNNSNMRQVRVEVRVEVERQKVFGSLFDS